MTFLWIKSSVAWGGTGLRSGLSTPSPRLQTVNVQHSLNTASTKVFLKQDQYSLTSSWDSRPHNSPISVALQAFILVTLLCSQPQGQHAHGEVWFSCLGFYHFLLPWPDFDASLFYGDLEWQEQGVIASKQSWLSEPSTLWGKEQSCLPTKRKNEDTWSLISKENKANRGFNYKFTDNQLALCLGSFLFWLFCRKYFKLRK